MTIDDVLLPSGCELSRSPTSSGGHVRPVGAWASTRPPFYRRRAHARRFAGDASPARTPPAALASMNSCRRTRLAHGRIRTWYIMTSRTTAASEVRVSVGRIGPDACHPLKTEVHEVPLSSGSYAPGANEARSTPRSLLPAVSLEAQGARPLTGPFGVSGPFLL